MTEVTRSVPETVYIAEDGTEFRTKYECENYEAREKLDTVYLPIKKRNYNGEVAEVYGSEESVVEAIAMYKKPEDWTYEKAYVNERLWVSKIMNRR